MWPVKRRGVSLLELLLAINILLLFLAGVTTVVRGAGRVTARAVTALASERTAMVAAALLQYELRDGAWVALTLGTDRVGYPRRVGEGGTCDGSIGEAVVAQADWVGERTPDPTRDRLVALIPGGLWREAALTALAATSCPDGRPAWRLSMGDPLDSVAWVRIVEPTLYRRYRSGTSDWLGLAPADGSAPVQPFAGPLRPGAGDFRRTMGVLEIDLLLPSGVRSLSLPLDSRP